MAGTSLHVCRKKSLSRTRVRLVQVEVRGCVGAVRLMETFDEVLGGLVEVWDDGLILVTSDHGNMEDLSTRRHTDSDVPALVIGDKTAREEFTSGLKDLTDIAPAIRKTVMRD